MEKNPEDNAMQRTHLAVVIVGAALAFAGAIFFGSEVGISVAVGAMLAALNLMVLSRTVRRLVEGSSASWLGVALVKFLVLMAVVYGLIDRQLVQPLSLAVGFLAIPLGVLLSAGRSTPEPHVESDHA